MAFASGTSHKYVLLLFVVVALISIRSFRELENLVKLSPLRTSTATTGSAYNAIPPRNSAPLSSFENSLLARFNPVLHSSWTCTDETAKKLGQRLTKIIFVHVFKTAGSTMRQILASYAESCKAGYSILVSCSGLDYNLVHNDTAVWQSPKGQTCRQKKAMDRNQKYIDLGDRGLMRSSYLNNYDMLAGHLPIGIHEYWNETSNTQPMYLTFFREAVAKYVSGVIFVNKKQKQLSEDDIVQIIREKVTSALEKNEYRGGYSGYLLTPKQKQIPSLSMEEQVEMILSNIVDMPVAIGIVERMDESMKLVAHVLDGNKEHYEELVQGQDEHRNTGVISTSRVIAKLREDSALFAKVEEYVKYDQMVYETAFKLHQMQYEALLATQGETI